MYLWTGKSPLNLGSYQGRDSPWQRPALSDSFLYNYAVAVNSHAHIRVQDSDGQSKIAFTLKFNTFTFVIFPTTLDFF